MVAGGATCPVCYKIRDEHERPAGSARAPGPHSHQAASANASRRRATTVETAVVHGQVVELCSVLGIGTQIGCYVPALEVLIESGRKWQSVAGK